MGCQFGKPQVMTQVQEEVEVEVSGFSDTQIDTIRSTWPLLANQSVKVGVEIFVRIFREAPSIRALFQHLRTNPTEDLHQCPAFREHALHFMAVIQNLVDHLECPQTVDQQLLILGAKHATFQGYHPEYFRFFTKCMMEEWETRLGEEFIHEVRDSWRLAFDYVVDRMTEGFDMCLNGQIQDLLHASLPPGQSVGAVGTHNASPVLSPSASKGAREGGQQGFDYPPYHVAGGSAGGGYGGGGGRGGSGGGGGGVKEGSGRRRPHHNDNVDDGLVRVQ